MPIENELLLEVFQVLPRGLYLRNSDHVQRVLTGKRFALPSGEELDLAGDWQSVADLPRSLQRRLHMHCYVGDLLPDYRKIDPSSLQTCLELAKHWTTLFSYQPAAKLMAYHDETTARRVGYWLRIFVLAILSGNEQVAQEIKVLLQRELEVLVQDDFFAGLNNHGMFQDLTILYAAVLGLVDEALGAKSIARLQQYLLGSITSDGVHKEHSPAYHFLVAGQFFANISLIGRMSPQAAAEFSNILRRMGPYAVDIALPTGELPPIGDTSQAARPANYRNIFFLKEDETQPRPWAVYQDGGYAIFRTMEPSREEGIYALFTAAHHGNYHKHSDDLALVLYRKGWVLFESGPFGYDYDHPHSRHAYSNLAHNTLVVDEGPLLDREQGIGQVRITAHGQTEGGYFVEGVNKRIPGVVHRRRITFARDGRTIEIEDTVSSDVPHRFALLWHTPIQPELGQVDGKPVVKLGAGVTLAVMSETENDKFSIRLSHGGEVDGYRAFSYPKMGQSVEANVIIVEGDLAGEMKIKTMISLF